MAFQLGRRVQGRSRCPGRELQRDDVLGRSRRCPVAVPRRSGDQRDVAAVDREGGDLVVLAGIVAAVEQVPPQLPAVSGEPDRPLAAVG